MSLSEADLVGVDDNIEGRGESDEKVTDLDDNLPPEWALLNRSIAQDVIALLEDRRS